MPIQKSKTLPSGVTGDYWKLKHISIDLVGLKVEFQLGLYLDSAAAADGKNSLLVKKYILSVPADQIAGSLATAYTRILTLANSDVPNIGSEGTHKFDPDLVDGVIVA